MNYTIYNYKGDVLNESVSQEELEVIINSEDFNCFQFDVDIYETFANQHPENPESAYYNFRVYKPIVE